MKRLALLLAAVLLTGRAAPASVPASSNIPEQTAEPSSLLYWTPYTSIPNESGYFSVFHSADGTPLLSRYDFTDMTRHIVCDVPGCTHADSTCPAYLDDSAIVCVPDAVYTFLQQLDEHGTPLRAFHDDAPRSGRHRPAARGDALQPLVFLRRG